MQVACCCLPKPLYGRVDITNQQMVRSEVTQTERRMRITEAHADASLQMRQRRFRLPLEEKRHTKLAYRRAVMRREFRSDFQLNRGLIEMALKPQ